MNISPDLSGHYLGGSYDAFGIPRPIPFQKKDAKPDELFQELAAAEQKLRQDDLPKGKKAAALLSDRRLKSHLPTYIAWKNETKLGMIVAFFEKIIHLLKKLWPWRPKEIDQHLFAALTADRTIGTFPGMKQASLSELLNYLLRFLDKEKEEKIPRALRSQLSQCAAWAEKIEDIRNYRDYKDQEKALAALSKDITNKIGRLSKGQACLIPGGWLEGQKSYDALYEITKTDDQNYRLKIISRDPDVSPTAVLASAGKLKIHPETVFQSLKKEELADPLWMQALLGLQYNFLPEEGKSNVQINRSSFCGLLTAFQDRIVPPSADLKNYRTPTVKGQPAKNAWFLVDSLVLNGEHKSKRAQRMHLKAKLDTLFDFFEATHKELSGNDTNRVLLKQGTENAARLISLMLQQGHISQEETAGLQKELEVMDRYIARAADPNKGKPVKSPFEKSKASKFYELAPGQIKPVVIDPKEKIAKIAAPAASSRQAAESLSDALKGKQVKAQEAVGQLPAFEVHSIVKVLQDVEKECRQLVEQGKMAAVQDRLIPILMELPFGFKIEYDAHFNATTIQDQFWKQLSAEDRKACSRQLSVLTLLLKDAAVQTNCRLPDRLLAAVQAGVVQEYLARLNENETKLTAECSFFPIFENSIDLLKDGFAYAGFYYGTVRQPIPSIKEKAEKISAYRSYLGDQYREWRNTHPTGSSVWRFEDVKKRFNKNNLSPQIVDLEKQQEYFNVLRPFPQDPNTSMDKPGRFAHETWSRPIKNIYLRAASQFGWVSRGGWDDDPIRQTYGASWMTQEAIVDNPIRVLKKLKELYEERRDTTVAALQSTDQALPNLAVEDVRDLLLALDMEENVLGQMLGLLKAKRYLLESADIRNFLDTVIFNPKLLKSELGKNNIPESPQLWAECLHENIELLRNQGKILPALFLMEMNAKLRKVFALSPKYAGKENVFKDYSPLIKEAAEASLNPASRYFPHRHTLWKHVLLGYADAKALTLPQVQEIYKAKAVLFSAPEEESERDPLHADLLQRIPERWRSVFEDSANAGFAQSLLDNLCITFKLPLPEEKWSGTFPLFTAGNYRIDVMEGSIQNTQDGSVLGALAFDVMEAANVKEAFRGEKLNVVPMQRFQQQETSLYFFQDSAGAQNRIRKDGQGIVIHKKIQLQGKECWVQHVSKETVFPAPPKEEFDPSKGWKVFFVALKNRLFSPKKHLLPKFLMNGNYSFWINPQNKNEVIAVNEKGEPQFHLFVKKNRLEGIIDLRADASRDKMQVTPLEVKEGSFWNKVARFEDPEQIMVWRKGSQIVKVELPRFGFSFMEKDGKVVCTDPRMKNWILDEEDSGLGAKKGVSEALVLRHPSMPEKKRLIVAKREIVPVKEPEVALTFFLIIKLFIAALRRRIPDFNPFKDPLKEMVRLDQEKARYDICMFDVDPHTKELFDTSKSVEGYIYLAKISLMRHRQQNCLEYLHQAAKLSGPEFSSEEKAALQQLLEFPLQDADSTAVKLHALLIARKKSPESQRSQADGPIAREYKNFLAHGSNVDSFLRLTVGDEAVCLEALKKTEPHYYRQHVPLLSGRGTQGKKIAPASLNRNHFFGLKPSFSKKITDFSDTLFEALKKNPKKEAAPYLTRDASKISTDFLGLYGIAAKASLSSPQFRKVELTLRSLPTGSIHKDSGNNAETDFQSLLQQYLVNVLDVRRKGGDLADLPDAPQIDWNSFVVEKDKSKLANGAIKEERTEEEKKREEAERAAKESLSQFLIRLETFISRIPPQDPAAFAPVLGAVDDLAVAKAEEDIKKALDKMAKDESFSKMTIEDLEKALLSLAPEAHSAPLVKNVGQSLYKPSELDAFFVRDINPPRFKDLDLSGLKASANPDVRLPARELDEDISFAKGKATPPWMVKDEAARIQLEANLVDKGAKCEATAQDLKKKILDIANPSTSTARVMQQLGKLAKTLDWETLLKYFLQQDFDALAADLPQQADMGVLRQLMQDYLIAATEKQRIDRALAEVRSLHPDQEGLTAIGCENLYTILTAERQYDPANNLQILITEFLFDFLVREEQMRLVQDMLEDPDCVRQAITGFGKSSIVLLLLALKKANGSNMVTLQFPKALFETNLAYLQSRLGKAAQRYVNPIRFNMQMPLIVREKKIDLDGKETVEEISLFKGMYENMLRTILSKGVNASTMESLQALEQKWIRMIDLIAHMPEDQSLEPIQLQHFTYLTKILDLMDSKQELIIDEFDKALTPREERHLKVGNPTPVEPFIWQTSLSLYDKLLEAQELGLEKNIQAEVPEQQRGQILDRIAGEIAKEWAAKKQVPGTEYAAFCAAFVDYVRGRREDFLLRSDAWSAEEKDILSVTMNQFQTFLPLTLSKTYGVKYIRSKDGVSTVPCLYSDVAREGSEPEQILERINYTIQDYYQTGLRSFILEEWVRNLKNEAERELEELDPAKKKAVSIDPDKQEDFSIDKTTAGGIFRDYFPDLSLGSIVDTDIEGLLARVNGNRQLKRKFLSIVLAEMDETGRKITADGFNHVSMSAHTSGVSATMGCLHGLHGRIHINGAVNKGTTGKMVLNLLSKSSPELLRFDPEHPDQIISNALQQDGDIQSALDGVAAMHGISQGKLAKDLLDGQPINGKIKGIFFYKNGKAMIMTRQGEIPEEKASFKPEELGTTLSQEKCRGENVQLGPRNRALGTANGREPLFVVLQTAGRLRRDDQRIVYTVPKNSPLDRVEDIVKAGIAYSVVEADNLFRAKKQEPRDFLRCAMKSELMGYAKQCDLKRLAQRYLQFKPKGILVSETKKGYEVPGTYFQKHCRIEKLDAKPLDILEPLKAKFAHAARDVGLEEAAQKIEAISYSPEVLERMPAFVLRCDNGDTDKEVEVEKETEVESEKEVEKDADITVDNQTDEDVNFPRWRPEYNEHYAVHSLASKVNAAYDQCFEATENFLPLKRKEWMPAHWHRKPHDKRQNPVRHIHGVFEKAFVGHDWNSAFDSPSWGKPIYSEPQLNKVRLLDVLDTSKQGLERNFYSSMGSKGYEFIWDRRLKKVVRSRGEAGLFDAKKFEKVAVQALFFDGQYDRYSDSELEALVEWLKANDPDKMEKYFVEQVLQHRPRDREKYKFSQLKKAFDSLTL